MHGMKRRAMPDHWYSQTFAAYGLRFELRSNNPALLGQLAPHLPWGWQPSEPGEADVVYSLLLVPPGNAQNRPGEHLLYCGATLVACAPDLAHPF